MKKWIKTCYWGVFNFVSYVIRLRCFGGVGRQVVMYKPLRVKGGKFIQIGDNTHILNGLRIEAIKLEGEGEPSIVIGERVNIEQNVHITSAGNLIIGHDTSILGHTVITNITHPYQDAFVSPKYQKMEVVETYIGPNCMIGMGSVILPGTYLPENCIVGANSVVAGRFPAHCVVAGVPARMIRRWNSNSKEWERVDSGGS